ncbi:MAG: ricin-type beta-trefoil lectin domain protein, partial [Panacagrimonas sp.]
PPPPPPPPPPAPPPPPPPGDDQTFQVRNQRVTSKCLQPEDGSASVGDLLSAKLCNSANSAQAVTFSINSNGSARMIIGGLCVGSATGSFNNGSRLQLQACNGSTNQNFVSSSTRIAPFNAQGQVMDLHGGNLNDVIFWQDYGSINQRWNLSIVSGGVPPPDTTPDPFSFQAVTGAILGAVLTSNPVTIRGTTAAAPISVANGRYSIGCSGDFVSTASTISNDQAVCVQHDAASSASSSVTTMLNIGGVIGSFTSTTSAGSIPPPVDTTPDPFSFAASNGVDPGSTQISDTITISGINAPAPISVLNGAYSIGCAATFTSGPGTAEAGDTVCVRHSASTLPLTTVATTLAIGGVTATFTSETAGDGPSPAEPSFQVKNNWLTSKCLQPEDGVPSPGDLLSAKTCSATSAAQAVTFPANPNGSVRIMIGGLCAGSSNGSFSNGTRLQLQTCNSNGKQDFIRTGGRLSPASAQKQAMDLHGQDMNSVIFWQDFGGPNQRWTLVAR